jgi:hypothetical protein
VGRTRLHSANADPVRANSAAAIASQDRQILVEGWSDYLFLSKKIQKMGLKIPVQTVDETDNSSKHPKKRKQSNKRRVITACSSNVKFHGLVDMDHDFESLEVQHARVTDTNDSCNLFSRILQLRQGGLTDIAKTIVDQLGLDPFKRPTVLYFLDVNKDQFNNYVEARTAAILYRGWESDLPPRGKKPEVWPEDEKEWVNDLIPQSHRGGFSKFIQLFSPDLKDAGANDHELRDALTLILQKHIPESEEDWGKKIDDRMNTLMEYRKDSLQVAEALLEGMGITDHHGGG